MIANNISCLVCSSTLHVRGECPVEYANFGRQLPGFSKSGKRLAGKWNGTEPKRAKDNFSKGVRAALYAGAPGISEFRDRAKKAPP